MIGFIIVQSSFDCWCLVGYYDPKLSTLRIVKNLRAEYNILFLVITAPNLPHGHEGAYVSCLRRLLRAVSTSSTRLALHSRPIPVIARASPITCWFHIEIWASDGGPVKTSPMSSQ